MHQNVHFLPFVTTKRYGLTNCHSYFLKIYEIHAISNAIMLSDIFNLMQVNLIDKLIPVS